jgi:hypothetical protein
MDFAMKQKKTDISLEEKARRANGLSRSCSKCNHFPCSEVFVSGEGEKGKKLEVGIKNVYFFLGLRRCGLFIFYGKIFLILKLSML